MRAGAPEPPERLRWAVEELAPGPGDHVLEVGCGTGVAAALVLERLVDGTLTAVDRSPAAIRAALRHNDAAVAAGRAGFLAVALAEADLGRAAFDRVLAVNVNDFWLRPAPVMAVLHGLLRPGGAVCLVFQPPAAAGTVRIVEGCTRGLEEQGFHGIRVRHRPMQPVPAVCIHARR